MYLKGCSGKCGSCSGCGKTGLRGMADADYGKLIGAAVGAFTGLDPNMFGGILNAGGGSPGATSGGGGSGQAQNTNTNVATTSSSNIVNPNIITAVNTQVSPNISPNFNQQASSSSGGFSSGGGTGGSMPSLFSAGPSPFGAVNQGSASTPSFTAHQDPYIYQPSTQTTTQTPTVSVSPTQTGAPTGRTPGVDAPMYGGGGYDSYPLAYPSNAQQNSLLMYGAIGALLYAMFKKPAHHAVHHRAAYRQFRGR